jgi:hypothetical protein
MIPLLLVLLLLLIMLLVLVLLRVLHVRRIERRLLLQTCRRRKTMRRMSRVTRGWLLMLMLMLLIMMLLLMLMIMLLLHLVGRHGSHLLLMPHSLLQRHALRCDAPPCSATEHDAWMRVHGRPHGMLLLLACCWACGRKSFTPMPAKGSASELTYTSHQHRCDIANSIAATNQCPLARYQSTAHRFQQALILQNISAGGVAAHICARDRS